MSLRQLIRLDSNHGNRTNSVIPAQLKKVISFKVNNNDSEEIIAIVRTILATKGYKLYERKKRKNAAVKGDRVN